MPDLQSLIKLLKSDNPNKRYDACEQLRVRVLQEPLPQEAIDALNLATSDSNPDVADAAQRALTLHTQISNEPELGQEQDKAFTVADPPKTNKGLDFTYGFFGCLIIWNSLGILTYFLSNILLSDGSWFPLILVDLFVFIGSLIPFITNKKWIGFGAVSYGITNAILMGVRTGFFKPYFPFFTFLWESYFG